MFFIGRATANLVKITVCFFEIYYQVELGTPIYDFVGGIEIGYLLENRVIQCKQETKIETFLKLVEPVDGYCPCATWGRKNLVPVILLYIYIFGQFFVSEFFIPPFFGGFCTIFICQNPTKNSVAFGCGSLYLLRIFIKNLHQTLSLKITPFKNTPLPFFFRREAPKKFLAFKKQ